MKRLNAIPDVVDNKMMKNGKAAAELFEKYGHLWMTLGYSQTLFMCEEKDPTTVPTYQERIT
ncbi:hypothetical protein K3495_g5187 [Podosphaera aphanis]|nr:hypothetical protein K3495_g5187 [Podosphaera aphanis]